MDENRTTGTAKNAVSQTIAYSFKGHFVTRTKAKGTYKLARGGCTQKPVDFVAKKYDPNAG